MKEFKQLYIFVEGPDDERFFDNVFKPLALDKYNFVKIIKYAGLTKKIVKDYIKAFSKQNSSEYLFVCDFDARVDTSFCVTKRKNKEVEKFGNILEPDKIRIVKEEIESWYLAGITSSNLKKFKIRELKETELIDKEQFIDLIPRKFQNKTDFLIEIIKEFDIETGINKNNSMKYFITKLEQ